jgi:hypothetical protein
MFLLMMAEFASDYCLKRWARAVLSAATERGSRQQAAAPGGPPARMPDRGVSSSESWSHDK